MLQPLPLSESPIFPLPLIFFLTSFIQVALILSHCTITDHISFTNLSSKYLHIGIKEINVVYHCTKDAMPGFQINGSHS